VAIVQISRITNRKGLQENLPQLAGAELGWSIDERRLYIGNGTLEEGAPVIGNTEILTEFSDILEFQTTYTYKGEAAGYTVQTGPTAGTPITQSLQSWLDQFATVKDFGAVGDGVADDTDAINRALYQLFCRETNPQIRRSLFFPAGVYKVSQSINIPPYATLYGEGADNSVIQLQVGDDSTLHECVARTADSLQQIGASIGANGATPPEYITITNMGFQSLDPTVDVFIVEDASNCTFTSVNFTGPLTRTDLASSANDIRAVAFASSGSNQCYQITFNGCIFSGTTYGTETDQVLGSVTFTNGEFNFLYQGVVLEGTNVTGVRITGNQFWDIYAEGIIFGSTLTPGLNASGHNIFYDVGNHFLGEGSPFTPIIDIQSDNNISISDMFRRNDAAAQSFPRIQLGTTISIATTNGSQLAMGSYVRETGVTKTLINDTTANVFEIDATVIRAFVVNYTIVRNFAYRTGTIMVASDVGDSSTGVTSMDDYVENNNTGVALTVTQSGDIVSLDYTANEQGVNGTMTYSITHLA
jgi:hypothetical protein